MRQSWFSLCIGTIVLDMAGAIIVPLELLIEDDNGLQVRSRQWILFARRESTNSLHDILDLVKES
jgi:hypothetical protein